VPIGRFWEIGFAHYEGGEGEVLPHRSITGISLDEISIEAGIFGVKAGGGGGKWQQHTGSSLQTGPYWYVMAGTDNYEISIGFGGSAQWITRITDRVSDWEYDRLSELVGDELLSRTVLGIADGYQAITETLRRKRRRE